MGVVQVICVGDELIKNNDRQSGRNHSSEVMGWLNGHYNRGLTDRPCVL